MPEVNFTPEEISVIDKKLAFIIFNWAKHLINHILFKARKNGVIIVYMNTSKTIESGDTSKEKLEYFYERLPPQLGFKLEQVDLRGSGKETLWANHLSVRSSVVQNFIKLAQTVALKDIPPKYQGAFIGILGRKPEYTKEEMQKVVSILEKKKPRAKSIPKFYYDWNREKWAGSQRFNNNIKEMVVLQKIPVELQEFINNDPVLVKFWAYLLARQQHFGPDVIGFALVSPVAKNIWVINEIQTDCLNRYLQIRRKYMGKKDSGKGITWETLADMLTANNRSHWVDRIRINEPLKKEILDNPQLINLLPDDEKNIDEWIKENKEKAAHPDIANIMKHLSSVNFNTRIFRLY